MDDNFIRNRINELRIQKDVSERSMSIDLGHSPSYIHSIVSRKALPSMTEYRPWNFLTMAQGILL